MPAGHRMTDLITDDDLARARLDPFFRRRLLASNLDRLLAGLKKLRRSEPAPENEAQLREGAELAVKLADLLHQVHYQPPDAA